jgi:hypothetical protein
MYLLASDLAELREGAGFASADGEEELVDDWIGGVDVDDEDGQPTTERDPGFHCTLLAHLGKRLGSAQRGFAG